MKIFTLYIFIVFYLDTLKSCNLTYFNEWKLSEYDGPLKSDSVFWIYQNQKNIFLTNGLAIDIAYKICHQEFENLYIFKAGRMGPIDPLHAYETMCSSYCLENDRIISEVASNSGCTCLELSTQPNSTAYHIAGDICLRNTGRLLCNIVGFCGVWQCDLNDFMCPRYEYNKHIIRFKGPGSCSGAESALPAFTLLLSAWIALVLCLVLTS